MHLSDVSHTLCADAPVRCRWGAARVIDGFETVELINSLGTNTFAGPVNADIRIVVRTLVAWSGEARHSSSHDRALSELCGVMSRRPAVFLGSGGMA